MTADEIPETPAAEQVYNTVGLHGDDLAAARAAANDALDTGAAAIIAALEAGAQLNIAECARRLGVTRQTLYDRIPPTLLAMGEVSS